MAQAFNAGKGRVFLISLKAGGTGLNLTGADTVIHIDPWWNQAVEDQATDRAYRIGQKNAVQVFKLLSDGTVEEKVSLLQAKKKANQYRNSAGGNHALQINGSRTAITFRNKLIN